MLVLTRRIGEEIVINGNVRVRVLEVNGTKVRIGVSAPDNVRIDRSEVSERRKIAFRSAGLNARPSVSSLRARDV